MDMLISKYAWISMDIHRYLYISMISKCSNSQMGSGPSGHSRDPRAGGSGAAVIAAAATHVTVTVSPTS